MNSRDYANNSGERLDFGGDSSVNVNEDVDMSNVTLLTMKQVEALLKISTWGLYQLVNSNAIPTVRIGSRRFVRLSTLQEYINTAERRTIEGGNYG
jgi:excisionase family DNA binding protein